MRVLAISGSLRAGSSNSAVLRAAVHLAPSGVEVVVYNGLALLPPFNPDLDTDDPPPSVVALRAAVSDCDGLLVSIPEYAHGLPGTFKNGLDWLVGSLTFPGKFVAIIATTPRAIHAPAQLREVLTTMAGQVIEEASIVLSLPGATFDEQTFLSNLRIANAIQNALTTFARVIASSSARRVPCA